jgi:hypothetical protein
MKSADALAGFAVSRQMLRWMLDNEVMESPEALSILAAGLRDLENGRTDASTRRGGCSRSCGGS